MVDGAGLIETARRELGAHFADLDIDTAPGRRDGCEYHYFGIGDVDYRNPVDQQRFVFARQKSGVRILGPP